MSKPKVRRSQGGLEGLRRTLAQEEQARADAAAVAASRGGAAGGTPEAKGSSRGSAATNRSASGHSASNRRGSPQGKTNETHVESGAVGTAPTSAPDAAEIFPLDASDHALFQRAVRGVTPIGDTRRALLPPVPAASARELRLRREAAAGQAAPVPAAVSDQYVPAAAARDASSFLRAGCGPDLLKGLRRGKWAIGATLDLHGSTLDEARQRLDQFLQSCLTHQVRCVCVIHGKGHGSRRGEPVLKTTVRHWLAQLDCVQAYVECREEDGGSGAVQVLLRAAEGA
jgi:DNA-nicking Smr family endonuclease